MNKTISQILIYILFCPSIVLAGSIDLNVEVNPLSINNLLAGDVGEFSVTISNAGVDEAGANSSLSHPISIDTEIIYLEADTYSVEFTSNPNISQECLFYPFIIDPTPGNPVGVIYSFYTPSIPPGQSITCHGLYYIYSNNGGRTVKWSSLSVTDNDTDPSNDVALMTFRGYIPPVPSLTIYGLILLVGVIMVITFRFRIRH
ncbi:MAG: hypothetical protein DWP95_13240 [Proteobacteria bacterium]|nr:MAG: hypothetical protein DWP95_13240 [Pseudomonadota bacterium]